LCAGVLYLCNQISLIHRGLGVARRVAGRTGCSPLDLIAWRVVRTRRRRHGVEFSLFGGVGVHPQSIETRNIVGNAPETAG
jgi:hypothetical protein